MGNHILILHYSYYILERILFLFIFGCAGSSLLRGPFSSCSCSKRGLLSSCGVQASHCSGPSCCRAWAIWCAGSVVEAPGFWSTGSMVVAHEA